MERERKGEEWSRHERRGEEVWSSLVWSGHSSWVVQWSGHPVRSGLVQSGPVLVRSSLVWSGLVRSIPVGLVRSGLVWCLVQSVRSGPVRISGPGRSGPAGAVHVLLVGTPHRVRWYIFFVHILVTIKKGTRTSFCLCFVSNNNPIFYVLQYLLIKYFRTILM